ncbi:hypothetical protein SBA1_20042 [Candidatus Sulfotelmatobacter kueseliae]|uniref:Uncharacterized protein n=1 Tax=Candidatus Sulfotelmatobacter kueseliae TaxID=2042962 RepID=A0A2U3KF87_9BACT|nr:hypothetical protein SBA1_20042 [Candidatus Sulfotelmatobacter kueseliae]
MPGILLNLVLYDNQVPPQGERDYHSDVPTLTEFRSNLGKRVLSRRESSMKATILSEQTDMGRSL